MASSPPSSQTLQASLPQSPPRPLDLGSLPPIFVSATHFDLDDLYVLEEKLGDHNALLTYDITEAKIVLSRVERKRRAQFDLQSKGLWTKEVDLTIQVEKQQGLDSRGAKRQKLDSPSNDKLKAEAVDDANTQSETQGSATQNANEPGNDGATDDGVSRSPTPIRDLVAERLNTDTVKVLKISWLEHSLSMGFLQPLGSYLIFEGQPMPAPSNEKPQAEQAIQSAKRPQASFGIRAPKSPQTVRSILERAKADAPASGGRLLGFNAHPARKFGRSAGSQPSGASYESGVPNSQYAHLLHQTTSEYDAGASSDLPEMPDWVKQDVKYACQRSTPPHNPNEAFIDLLKEIRTARLLTNDEIGVRAYSTSIASIAAYPYPLSSPREILALPGCDVKIANLFVEYANTGQVTAAASALSDPDLTILRLFYNIWGVGATTAREFYYERGWRELDDIVEFGWSTLSRVQQIGVKYYDEFLSPIPRPEVESIASIIHRHAVKVRDSDIQSLVVGGYRRGKEMCGDVDIIVSHPDEAQTANIVTDIVASLEDEGWITHTLLLALTSTHRDQQPLPYRSSGVAGAGFDSLDKALVVWQDPHFTPPRDEPKAKNSNIHRRVDIIIAPWRSVGCAVTGWSGGTTFQRDLRRYAKYAKGWKFDSSGIRERGTGRVVDVERYEDKKGRAQTMLEAEKRVFEAMGLVFRQPGERCTG